MDLCWYLIKCPVRIEVFTTSNKSAQHLKIEYTKDLLDFSFWYLHLKLVLINCAVLQEKWKKQEKKTPEFTSSLEYLRIIRAHKHSDESTADGHLPAAVSWLSVPPLEFCTAQSRNPSITIYLRHRVTHTHKYKEIRVRFTQRPKRDREMRKLTSAQININAVNMHFGENKPALSLFFDIVQLFTTPHLENVCQKNAMKAIWWGTGHVYTCYEHPFWVIWSHNTCLHLELICILNESPVISKTRRPLRFPLQIPKPQRLCCSSICLCVFFSLPPVMFPLMW